MRVYSAEWVIPVEGDPIAGGGVAIDDGRIAAVGPADELEGDRVHFAGSVVTPGFVNAHSHLEYAVYAGFGDGLTLGPWIALHIERKLRLNWQNYVAIARLGAAECLASGITTVADASFSGAAAPACAEMGLRGLVGLEVFGSDAGAADLHLRETYTQIEDAFSDRVRLASSPHAPYSTSPEVYRAAAAFAKPVITHLAESDDELSYLLRGEGPINEVSGIPPAETTSVRHLAAEGLLNRDLIAAHCVKVDQEEIDLLAASQVGVAHCPRSNAVLGCGTAPLTAFREAGILLGLGTDSPASAPSFDMFDEMRAAVYSARSLTGQPGALLPGQALELATLGGACVLGLEQEIGSLVPGKRADLTVVSLSGTAFQPLEDPAVALVYAGSPSRVLRTLVDGNECYERGGFEWLELRREAEKARGLMLSQRAPREASKAQVVQKT